MVRFLLTRLALLLLGLVVASALIFFSLRILPGDVAQVIAGTDSTPERIEAIRADLGLYRPLAVQYWDWVWGILHLDLGNSLITGTPVVSELTEKAQVTIPLGLLALFLAVAVGFPLGVLAAIRSGRIVGTTISASSQAAASVPVVWAGLILISLFSFTWKLFPSQGFPRGGWQDPAEALRRLILPAVTIAIIEGAVLLRFVRSAVLDAIGEDFVRTAAAKGLTRTKALVTHGIPNVLLSVVSILGIQVAGLLVGAIVVEQLFNLPGIGRMLVTDVGNRDLVKVQSELLTMTGFVLLVGTVVDVIHRLLDPRLRETP